MKKELLLFFELIFSLILNNNCERCKKYTKRLFYKTTNGPFTNTGLTCGKSEPKEQTDCTPYGTDSGMYCCWVAKDENDTNGKCHLISGKKIDRNEIDGCAKFADSYWSCGNFAHNLKINKIILMLLIIKYFFYY